VRLVVIALAAVIVFTFVLRPVWISGKSMEPTYADGGFNFIFLWSYAFRAPARGDVVAVKTTGISTMLFKRIVGLPGERVAFRGGRLLINGIPVSEPYITTPCTWDIPEVTVGEEEYFVVGDNRTVDYRGHSMGRAQREKIAGRPIF